MIKSFRHREAEEIWSGKRSKHLPGKMQERALKQLARLHAAVEIFDLRLPPSNRLEKLSGGRRGYWSIRINDQWRLCFRWDDGAHDVEITDYH